MISQPYSLTHSISHSLTSVGKHQERNIKKQETSSLKKTNKHQESLTQKPRENQEQESRFQSPPPPSLSPLRDFWVSSAFQGFWVWVLFLVVWVFFVVFLASSFFFLHRRLWALAHFKPSFKHFKHAYTFFSHIFSLTYISKTPEQYYSNSPSKHPIYFPGYQRSFLGYCVYWFTEIQFVKLLNNFKT